MSRFVFIACLCLTVVSSFRGRAAAEGDGLDGVRITQISPTLLVRDAAKGLSGASPPDCIAQEITFVAGSSWMICVKAMSRFGLVVSHASFRRSPTSPFVLVLSDGRFSEILVPYNNGVPRLMDIVSSNFPVLALSAGSVTRSDCPAPRTLIDDSRICRDARDAGIAVKKDAMVRRGQEVSYYSVLDADNYDYIAEWSFRDDGAIIARAGATGSKRDGPDDTNGHAHNFTWRLDIDLNGAAGDSACVTRRIGDLAPFYSTAVDRCDMIEFEGGRQWNASEFTSIVVSDSALRNGRGRQTEYELIPIRTGLTRHTELFSRNDFWVTRAKDDENLAAKLPEYANGQPTIGQDNIIWYTGSLRHEDHMRDEDREAVPVIWAGFELRPRNLFDGTPFIRD